MREENETRDHWGEGRRVTESFCRERRRDRWKIEGLGLCRSMSRSKSANEIGGKGRGGRGISQFRASPWSLRKKIQSSWDESRVCTVDIPVIKQEDYPVGRRGKRGARGGGEEGRENVAERIKRLGRFLSNFLSLPPSLGHPKEKKWGRGRNTGRGRGQELAAF